MATGVALILGGISQKPVCKGNNLVDVLSLYLA